MRGQERSGPSKNPADEFASHDPWPSGGSSTSRGWSVPGRQNRTVASALPERSSPRSPSNASDVTADV